MIREITAGSMRYRVEVLGPDPDLPGWAIVRFLGTGHESRVQFEWLEVRGCEFGGTYDDFDPGFPGCNACGAKLDSTEEVERHFERRAR